MAYILIFGFGNSNSICSLPGDIIKLKCPRKGFTSNDRMASLNLGFYLLWHILYWCAFYLKMHLIRFECDAEFFWHVCCIACFYFCISWSAPQYKEGRRFPFSMSTFNFHFLSTEIHTFTFRINIQRKFCFGFSLSPVIEYATLALHNHPHWIFTFF